MVCNPRLLNPWIALTPNCWKDWGFNSFLSELNKKKEAGNDIDVSQYKVGQKIYHKKFGEGVITKLDPEGDDYKVDIDFDKVGHKRLMAKFAGLEIIE